MVADSPLILKTRNLYLPSSTLTRLLGIRQEQTIHHVARSPVRPDPMVICIFRASCRCGFANP